MDLIIAALWGFGEATAFFLAPDVWLTRMALQGLRRALLGCLCAVAGALLGGSLLFLWGVRSPEAPAALERFLAVTPDMVRRVEDEVRTHGFPALFLGPLTGTPYKIYAVQAGRAGWSMPTFLLVSVPARLFRFALMSLMTWWLVSHTRLKSWTIAKRQLAHAACWCAWYAWYFSAI